MNELLLPIYDALPEGARPAVVGVLGLGALFSVAASVMNGVERAMRNRGEVPPRWMEYTLAVINPLAGNVDKAVEMADRLRGRKIPAPSSTKPMP